MHFQGFVEQRSGGKWFLTDAAMPYVQHTTMRITNPRPMFEVREDLALEDRTCYELVCMLKRDHWTWGEWIAPSKRKRKEMNAIVDAYIKGARKDYYTTLTTHSEYLQSLLRSDDLFNAGVKAIPHGRSAKQYGRILALKWDGVQDLAIENANQLDVEPAEVDDLGGLEEAGVAGDVGLVGEAIGKALDELDKPESDGEVSNDSLLHGFAMELGFDLHEPDRREAHSPTSPEHHGPEEPAPELVPIAAPAPLPAPSPPSPHAVPRPPRVPFEGLSKQEFGCFTVTPEASGGKHGGFRVRCPWHRKNAKTDCKRWFRVKGPELSDKIMTARCIMSWCNDAFLFGRQRNHRIHDPDPETVPELDFLKAGKITEIPVRGDVIDDDTLDAMGVPEEVSWWQAMVMDKEGVAEFVCPGGDEPAPEAAEPAGDGVEEAAVDEGVEAPAAGGHHDAASPVVAASSSDSSSSSSDSDSSSDS